MDKYNDIQQEAIDERIDRRGRGCFQRRNQSRSRTPCPGPGYGITYQGHSLPRSSKRKSTHPKEHQEQNPFHYAVGMLNSCPIRYLLWSL